MRNCVLLLGVLFFTGILNAQAQEVETLVHSGIKISGFGGPTVNFSSIGNNEFAVMVGGGGGMIVNQKYFIGGYGEGLSTLHKRPDVYHTGFDPNNEPLTGPEYQNLAVSFGHGGIWLGYINNSNKLIHWGVQSKIGGGGIALYDRKYNFDEYNEVANDAVFVLEPEILLEVNITKWFKTSFSLGYRYVGSVNNSTYFNNEGKEIPYYDKTEFNSPLAGINFMFGGFSKR